MYSIQKSQSLDVKLEDDLFIVRPSNIGSSWVLFDSLGLISPTPVGPDMIYGSSFGIPSGTVPSNNVNQIFNTLPVNNPFFLERIRVYIPFYDTVANPIIGGDLFLGGLTQYNLLANGRSKVLFIPGVRTFLQSDKEGRTFDFPINSLIDGTCVIIPELGRYYNCTISFKISYQKLTYKI